MKKVLKKIGAMILTFIIGVKSLIINTLATEIDFTNMSNQPAYGVEVIPKKSEYVKGIIGFVVIPLILLLGIGVFLAKSKKSIKVKILIVILLLAILVGEVCLWKYLFY